MQFNHAKSDLIHFSKKRIPLQESVYLPDSTEITPSDSLRWLGIIFDRKLQFKEHVQQKAATATRVHHLTQRLMRKEWGLPTHLSRQLFKTCIVPIIDYGSVIWWNQQKTLIQPLAKLQNKAARDIIGAFKTSPQAAVEIETGLLPTHLRLQQTVQRYATRILTLP